MFMPLVRDMITNVPMRAFVTFPTPPLTAVPPMYDEAMADMATAWGLEHDFENHGWDIEKTIEHCKHMIGFDHHIPPKVYHRHGKAFYKAYRNYWYGKMRDDFEYMCHKTFGYMVRTLPSDDGYVYYSLTEDGLRWLGNKMHLTIRETD